MYATSLALASGVTIPDSKIAREVTELVRDTENFIAVQPLKPRLLLFCRNWQTERSQVRCGATVCECDVP